MKQSIVHIALVVKDYDQAIAFYTQKLNFVLLEDTYQPEQDKRWVVVSPPGSSGANLLLARASDPDQERFIGNQTGGRVFLFLNTDEMHKWYFENIPDFRAKPGFRTQFPVVSGDRTFFINDRLKTYLDGS